MFDKKERYAKKKSEKYYLLSPITKDISAILVSANQKTEVLRSQYLSKAKLVMQYFPFLFYELRNAFGCPELIMAQSYQEFVFPPVQEIGGTALGHLLRDAPRMPALSCAHCHEQVGYDPQACRYLLINNIKAFFSETILPRLLLNSCRPDWVMQPLYATK